MAIVGEFPSGTVENIEPGFCAYPQMTLGVLQDGSHVVVGERARRVRVMPKTCNDPAVRLVLMPGYRKRR